MSTKIDWYDIAWNYKDQLEFPKTINSPKETSAIKWDWLDSIHEQCHAAGVPIFMKDNLRSISGGYRHTLPQELPE